MEAIFVYCHDLNDVFQNMNEALTFANYVFLAKILKKLVPVLWKNTEAIL